MTAPAATTHAGSPPPGKTAVVLWWLPVGAGGHVVRHTSWWWEVLDAHRAHRPPRPLFHAALEVHVGGHRHVIEMAPHWGGPPGVDRGVVVTGPVGLRVLGRSRLFRYEVRCWREGSLPDREWAVGGPVVVTDDDSTARSLLRHVREVPALTWGRTVPPSGEMWNSNSLIAWLLRVSGVPISHLHPPAGGRAPGWAAGAAVPPGSAAFRQEHRLGHGGGRHGEDHVVGPRRDRLRSVAARHPQCPRAVRRPVGAGGPVPRLRRGRERGVPRDGAGVLRGLRRRVTVRLRP